MHPLRAERIAETQRPVHPGIADRGRLRPPATVQLVAEIKAEKIRMQVEPFGACPQVDLHRLAHFSALIKVFRAVKGRPECSPAQPARKRRYADIQSLLSRQFHKQIQPVQMSGAHPLAARLECWPKQHYPDVIGAQSRHRIQVWGNFLRLEIVSAIPPLAARNIVEAESDAVKGQRVHG